MKQTTLAMAADQGAGFELNRRPTKRDAFLQTMNDIVPWSALCEVIEPHYPRGEGGRPLIGLERMHFVQHWFNLADKACEEALLDSASLRRFVGIDLGRERVPDATTLLNFRRLLNNHNLGEKLQNAWKMPCHTLRKTQSMLVFHRVGHIHLCLLLKLSF